MITKIEVNYSEISTINNPAIRKRHVNKITAETLRHFKDGSIITMEIVLTEEERANFMSLCNLIEARLTCEVKDA
jgi:hypothetical protein